MKIRNQLIISMIVFGIVLVIIAASAIDTNFQVTQLSNQQDITQNIQNSAGNLTHISTDYFFTQENDKLTQWQEEITSLTLAASEVKPTNSEQQKTLENINVDIQQLNASFNTAVSYLETAPRNQSIRILPEFQTIWSSLTDQNQALTNNSVQLLQSIGNLSDELKTENSILVVALLGAVGAYFVTIYFVAFRRALKSISKLQAGTNIVGTGNLNYSVETNEKNEVGELSKAFNQMTANLRNLTASKTQLEQEISERKKIEEQLKTSKSLLEHERNLLGVIMDEPKNMHLVYLDRDFNFLRVNEAYAKTCGHKPEEMIGKNHFVLYPDEENEVVFTRVRDTGEPVSFHDKPFVFPDQPERGVTYWDWTLSPIKNSEKVVGLVFSLVETTERKRAEEELIKVLEAYKLRQAEVDALLTAAKAVLQNRDFRSSARVIFDSCKQLLGAASGYVALLNDDGKDNIVLFLESGGLPCNVDPALPMPIRGLRAKTYSTGKVMFENNFPKSEWTRYLPKGHINLRNVLFAPLKVDGKTVGIMGLGNKPESFSEHDAQLGLAFGEIASIALINSNMFEVLEENQRKLRDYSENLEKMVEEKTKQLKDAERLATIGATAGMVGHYIRNPLQAIIGDLLLASIRFGCCSGESRKRGY